MTNEMKPISDIASYCAHCGHIEPSNLDDVEKSNFTIGMVFVHKEDCRAVKPEHKMFVALWNARTHMQLNDVLTRRAEESIRSAMRSFIDGNLNSNSHFVVCEKLANGQVH